MQKNISFFASVQVFHNSAPVIAAVTDSILIAVNSGCSSRCYLAASNIRDSRLVCCDEQKDEIAFQAKIYGTDNNELKNQIQKWVDSQPQIGGWDAPLNVSNVWQYGLLDDAFFDSEAKCKEVQSSQSNLLSSDFSASTITLSVFLAIALVLFALLLMAIGIVWYRKKYKPAPPEDRYEVT